MKSIEETHPSLDHDVYVCPNEEIPNTWKHIEDIKLHTVDKQVLIDTIRSVDEDGLSRQTCDEILKRLGLPLTVFGMKIKKELGLDK